MAIIASQPSGRAADDEKLVTITANDTLKFSVTEIDASPGQAIHVQLKDEGTVPKETMGHNWILLDSDDEAVPYATAAMSSHGVNYEPKELASHVLASIQLIGPKEVGDVSFAAPAKTGKYPFICSFPGHMFAGMRGELIVK